MPAGAMPALRSWYSALRRVSTSKRSRSASSARLTAASSSGTSRPGSSCTASIFSSERWRFRVEARGWSRSRRPAARCGTARPRPSGRRRAGRRARRSRPGPAPAARCGSRPIPAGAFRRRGPGAGRRARRSCRRRRGAAAPGAASASAPAPPRCRACSVGRRCSVARRCETMSGCGLKTVVGQRFPVREGQHRQRRAGRRPAGCAGRTSSWCAAWLSRATTSSGPSCAPAARGDGPGQRGRRGGRAPPGALLAGLRQRRSGKRGGRHQAGDSSRRTPTRVARPVANPRAWWIGVCGCRNGTRRDGRTLETAIAFRRLASVGAPDL